LSELEMNFLSKTLIFMILLTAVVCPFTLAAQDEEFKTIKLDRFIEKEKKAVDSAKKKLIIMAAPIRFEAKMKRFPEERNMSYVYTAMELAGINPMPEVSHRMFIESVEGRIIPVYVEKQTVAKLKTGLNQDEKAQFIGYHVYSYAKGPAILIVDFFSFSR